MHNLGHGIFISISNVGFTPNLPVSPPQLWEKRGLMASALDSRASGSGSSPGWGHCVVFLGKILYSHSASLHPGMDYSKLQLALIGD